jgi:hypothetical protein
MTTAAKLGWIAYLTVKFAVHVSSIGFGVSAAWQGNWSEAAMLATFAFMTA